MAFHAVHPRAPQVLQWMQIENVILLNDIEIFRILERRRRRREEEARPRRLWERPWLTRRLDLGWYHTLLGELETEDPASFRNFMRMEAPLFRELMGRLTPRIQGIGTNYRPSIPPGMKLAITLRHLASGDSYRSLSYGFRVAPNTIHYIVKEVCAAIIDEYREEVLTPPLTPEAWKQVADRFSSRWQFHHALGAIDGKHFAIRRPKNSHSMYHNYKGFFSLIMLAVVDADYKFIWVDIGSNGSASDAQIFNNCELKGAIENGTIGFPEPEPLPNDDRDMPFFLVGDDAFALKTWMMKPFSRRNMEKDEAVFNYRLSRARRIVENAFGILANRFQCFLGRLQQDPHVAKQMVMAAVTLHNLMRVRYPRMQNAVLDVEDDQHNVAPGAWRQDRPMLDLHALRGGNYTTREAKRQRLYLKHYYSHPVGAVPWQDRMVNY